MSSNEMPFFPPNFMLRTPPSQSQSHQDDHPPPTSLNSIFPAHHQHLHSFHGGASFLGKRSTMSFSGIELGDHQEANNSNNNNTNTNNNGDVDLSDDGLQAGEKKRRLNTEQVKTLEKNFELGNKLEPERKMQLATALGLQPRQIAIWFQNRRARWKTKQLEKDFDLLKSQFEAVKAENEALQAQNQTLHAQILALKCREPTESINLNKETEGSCSNRSDENSCDIKLDISTSRAPAAIDSPLSSDHPTSKPLFPSPRPGCVAQLFQTSSRQSGLQCQLKVDPMVKEESLTNLMFCSMDDQSGFWPWLDHQQFN